MAFLMIIALHLRNYYQIIDVTASKSPECKAVPKHVGELGKGKVPDRASYSKTETRRGHRSADAVAKLPNKRRIFILVLLFIIQSWRHRGWATGRDPAGCSWDAVGTISRKGAWMAGVQPGDLCGRWALCHRWCFLRGIHLHGLHAVVWWINCQCPHTTFSFKMTFMLSK